MLNHNKHKWIKIHKSSWSGNRNLTDVFLFTVLLPHQSPDKLHDTRPCPGHSPVDPIYGNLQIVFSFIFWSCQIISTERAKQHGQEQIQDLKPDQEKIQALKPDLEAIQYLRLTYRLQ